MNYEDTPDEFHGWHGQAFQENTFAYPFFLRFWWKGNDNKFFYMVQNTSQTSSLMIKFNI